MSSANGASPPQSASGFTTKLVIILLVALGGYLHSRHIDLLPTKLTDEERCFARGERLVGHVGDEIQCKHVDLAIPSSLADWKTHCELEVAQANANSGHILFGFRWFDSDKARAERAANLAFCDR